MVYESTSELGQSNQYVIAENLKYSSMSRVNGSYIQRLQSGSHLKLKFTKGLASFTQLVKVRRGFYTSEHLIFMKLLPDHLWH